MYIYIYIYIYFFSWPKAWYVDVGCVATVFGLFRTMRVDGRTSERASLPLQGSFLGRTLVAEGGRARPPNRSLPLKPVSSPLHMAPLCSRRALGFAG